MEFHYESLYQKQDDNEKESSGDSTTTTNTSNTDNNNTFDLLSKSIPTWGWGSFSSIVDSVKQKSENIINTYKEELQTQQIQAQQESSKVNVNLNQEDGIIIEEDVSDYEGEESLLTSPIIQNLSVLDIKNKISLGFSKFLSEFPATINNNNDNNSDNSSSTTTSTIDNFNLNNNIKSTTTTTSTISNIDIDEKELYFYSNDPVNSLYKQFRESFKLLDFQSKITQLLINNSRVSKSYLYLVPSIVLEFDFWSRHFFKEHLINITEKALQSQNNIDDDDEIKWDDNEVEVEEEIQVVEEVEVKKEEENILNSPEEESVGNTDNTNLDSFVVGEEQSNVVEEEQEQEEEISSPQETNTLVDTLETTSNNIIQDPLTSFSNVNNNVNNNNDNNQKQEEQEEKEEEVTLLQPVVRETPPITPIINNNSTTIPKKLSMVELNDWEVLSDRKSDEEDWGAWE